VTTKQNTGPNAQREKEHEAEPPQPGVQTRKSDHEGADNRDRLQSEKE